MQRILAWLLRKDHTHKARSVNKISTCPPRPERTPFSSRALWHSAVQTIYVTIIIVYIYIYNDIDIQLIYYDMYIYIYIYTHTSPYYIYIYIYVYSEKKRDIDVGTEGVYGDYVGGRQGYTLTQKSYIHVTL